MGKRLSGKVCAITGAGRGIGYEAARLFAEEGAQVFILEFDRASGLQAEEDARASGLDTRFIQCDVSSYDSVGRAFEKIERGAGSLHVLYNNAAIYLPDGDAKISGIKPDIWQRVLNVNLNGTYHCCRFSIPLMGKSGCGSIINTASSAAVVGVPGCDAYTASKGAIVALTRSMAVEYGPENIRVNSIAPAAVSTWMVKQSNLDDSEFDAYSFINLRTPLRRWGNPLEVAKLALFLASDDSSYINGANICVDGGITVNGDLSKINPGKDVK